MKIFFIFEKGPQNVTVQLYVVGVQVYTWPFKDTRVLWMQVDSTERASVV